MTSGAGAPRRAAVSLRRIARGPHHRACRRDAWTLTIQTPSGVAAATAVADGVRDVVKLQIEEDAVAALGERAHDRGPFGGEQPAADLESADGPAQRSASSSARRRVSTSSATRS